MLCPSRQHPQPSSYSPPQVQFFAPVRVRFVCFYASTPAVRHAAPGQWDMVTNLVGKYGVVPKSVFPESKTSTASLW